MTIEHVKKIINRLSRKLFQAFHLVSDSTALYKRGNRVVHMGRRNFEESISVVKLK